MRTGGIPEGNTPYVVQVSVECWGVRACVCMYSLVCASARTIRIAFGVGRQEEQVSLDSAASS